MRTLGIVDKILDKISILSWSGIVNSRKDKVAFPISHLEPCRGFWRREEKGIHSVGKLWDYTRWSAIQLGRFIYIEKDRLSWNGGKFPTNLPEPVVREFINAHYEKRGLAPIEEPIDDAMLGIHRAAVTNHKVLDMLVRRRMLLKGYWEL